MHRLLPFFADEKNFKKVVLTDGFVELMHKFPSILAEVREKVGA
jgi:speckle-type POZ protein